MAHYIATITMHIHTNERDIGKITRVIAHPLSTTYAGLTNKAEVQCYPVDLTSDDYDLVSQPPEAYNRTVPVNP